ncbi:MAG: ATP-binding protein [Candidatus Shapirobacteria bacterium]|jgi:signal transduction histidine kinase
MQNHSNTPKTRKIIEALWKLEKIILDTLDFNEVVQKICDGLLTELGYLKLGYRIIVLTLVDENKKVLKRISLSQTKEAARAQAASAVPFHKIDIPLGSRNNLLIKTLKSNQPEITHYWPDIFRPTLTDDQALANQKASGIKTSMLYPVTVKDKVIGVVIFSLIKHEDNISQDEKDLIRGFCDIVGLAVQNARLYTTLGETSEKLKQANAKLKELDVLKDEFVSVASHELRTPMTAIKSYLWMALSGQGGPLNSKQKFYLQRSLDSTERLIKLVNNMLNISRIESGRLSLELNKVDLSKLIEDAINEIAPRAKELGINLVYNPAPSLPKVIADADKIKEVVINLIGNSFKFTPKNGSITVNFQVTDDQVITSVTDTGSGLSPDMIKNLFQKFGLIKGSYQTNQTPTDQGTGLGLYICKQIIELHHGTISALSEGVGKGSTFSFSLPVYTPAKLKLYQKKFQHTSNIGIIHSKI